VARADDVFQLSLSSQENVRRHHRVAETATNCRTAGLTRLQARRKNCKVVCCAALLAAIQMAGAAVAQELAPRSYWPAPVGTNILLLGFQRNTGDIVIDPSLPISGVESEIDFFQVTYQRSFSLFGRSASAQFSLPFADGVTEGDVDGEFRRRKTTGLTDARVRMAVNLRGAPAMDADGFRALRAEPRTIVGASLLVQAPTGEYDGERLLNLGTNRWAVKPALGMIIPLHPTWLFEIEIGTWIFGDNDDFLGEVREQDPIVSTEIHLVKRIRPGFWASLDANYYRGGETRIGEDFNDDLQRNARAGVTIVIPLRGRHALRSSFSTGISTRSGGDFEILSLSYAFVW
jgi:hypothetical protein